MHNIEILAPAGSRDSLRAAVSAGADAVYIGGSQFGARAYADNPDEKELLEDIDYVHLHGRRIYLTVNTLFKEKELKELYGFLYPYYRQGIDAVIVQDVGAMRYIRRHFPELPIHVSTQAAVTGRLGAEFFGRLGAARIVPARELSLGEIREMKRSGPEIECFVHGAMCYSYSGQCLLSSMIGGRSGNRGQCAQPCRLTYGAGQGRTGDLLSLKDLCAIDLIPELAEAGVDSFKIEGRMKQPEYVYTVTAMYRKYMDRYLAAGREGYCVSEEDRRYLTDAYRRRGYCDGYYKRQNGREMISLRRPETAPGGAAGQKPEEPEGGAPHGRYHEIKEKINGKLILSAGKRVKLCLEYNGKEKCVRTVTEGAVVQQAFNAPLDPERVGRQMRKTGNTEFVFDRLEIDTEGQVFLPMQALNELRREGIAALTGEILAGYRRNAAGGETPARRETAMQEELREETPVRKGTVMREETPTEPSGTAAQKQDIPFFVSVRTAAQLEAVLRLPEAPETHEASEMSEASELSEASGPSGRFLVKAVCVDGLAGLEGEFPALIRKAGSIRDGNRVVRLFAAMPYIFRERAVSLYEQAFDRIAETYDGVLIRNWESLEWLRRKGYQGEIISDWNMYVFNAESRDFMRRAGLADYTLPQELNCRELREFCGDVGSDGGPDAGSGGGSDGGPDRAGPGGLLIAYGHQPVMITANCIRKTLGECRGKSGDLTLTDRMGKRFPVRNECGYCYNVIYNCAPLVLADMAEQIRDIRPSGLRLDFTSERGERTGEILRLYGEAFSGKEPVRMPDGEYTRGHFKRGVK